jgi:hypothetical protein
MDEAIMDHYRRRLKRFGMPQKENTAFFDNVIVQWVSIAVGVILVFSLIILMIRFSPDLTSVRLQYSIYFGTALHAQWWSPYILLVMGLIFYLANLGIASALYNARQRIAAYALLFGGLFVQISLLVAVVSIALNN